jgi:hypothetical protein
MEAAKLNFIIRGFITVYMCFTNHKNDDQIRGDEMCGTYEAVSDR